MILKTTIQLKICHQIIIILTYVFNSIIFRLSYFPTIWKFVLIIIILKPENNLMSLNPTDQSFTFVWKKI
ncbi:putative RNA-directed DNA polymerase [Aphis craccivora]|uniref:Putative RNA-directed DNA polymerase n=1 Tax=Aphis craccivora TaxID=307492 RepID=A0A6G0VW76_APHCR|nr:putative RNA-directed DNA polymerase [Aphis craccivora]